MSRSLFQLIFAFFRYFYSYFLNWQESWPSISKPARRIQFYWAGQGPRIHFYWAGQNPILLSWSGSISTELARIPASYSIDLLARIVVSIFELVRIISWYFLAGKNYLQLFLSWQEFAPAISELATVSPATVFMSWKAIILTQYPFLGKDSF